MAKLLTVFSSILPFRNEGPWSACLLHLQRYQPQSSTGWPWAVVGRLCRKKENMARTQPPWPSLSVGDQSTFKSCEKDTLTSVKLWWQLSAIWGHRNHWVNIVMTWCFPKLSLSLCSRDGARCNQAQEKASVSNTNLGSNLRAGAEESLTLHPFVVRSREPSIQQSPHVLAFMSQCHRSHFLFLLTV